MDKHTGERRSYWIETAPPGNLHPSQAADVTVDVAVIGARIAGLSIAWEVARSGRSVADLEADRIAAGVTGHTTAKLTALHTFVHDRLRRTRDIEAAKLYGRSQTEVIHHAAAIVEELGIECDWEDTAAFTYAAAAQKIEDLRVQLARAEDFAATLRTRLEHTTRS
jgi:glycine/D-amino acid oxidase-like deaminating enzyme